MNKPAWLSFWVVSLIWGSSFLLISIGVEELSATQLVLFRTVIAAIGLNLVRIRRGQVFPRDWPTIRAFILIGLGNATIPYTLISLGEQNISSGMAAVLQSTASFFTLIIAHFAFADERISPQKIAGLIVGFSGVIVLSSASIDGGVLNTSTLLGQLGIVGASLFYAIFAVYSRRLMNRQIAPIVMSSGTFIPAAFWAVLFVILEPIFGGRAFTPLNELSSGAWVTAFTLGFLNTFIAYLFFYYVIQQLGAFRASTVTYVIPAVGLFLGWLVGEEVTVTMFAGAAMIFAGIAIVNVQPKFMLKYLTRTRAVQPT